MPSPQRRRCGGRDPGGKPGTLWSEEQKPCAHDQGRPVHSPQGKEERRPGRGRGRGGGTLGTHLGSTPGTGRFLSSIPPPGPRGATVHEGHERRRGRRPRPGPAPARSWLAAPPRPPPPGPVPARSWLASRLADEDPGSGALHLAVPDTVPERRSPLAPSPLSQLHGARILRPLEGTLLPGG